MAKIIWAPKARKNLASIHTFIALDSEKYAFLVAEKIVREVSELLNYPGKGKIVPEFQNPDIRELKA
jgi:plasmid stabilization system protein ParE